MLQKKLIVHVSDAKISKNPDDLLITYSLGSCIGVCIYDPMLSIGGLLHYQLPESKLDLEKARMRPFMFADSGMKTLLNEMTSLGSQVRNLKVKIAGGASMNGSPKGFDIGKRNHLAIRKILWKNQLFISGEDIGGHLPRNLSLQLSDGTVTVKTGGVEKNL